jgi:phenylacetate-CoA ligase
MVKKFILNLRLPLQGNSLKSLSQVVSWQRSNQNQLLELQQERLKRLLVHAYKQVPYYRNILREAEVVTDNEEIMLDNFHKIPLLTKDIIRSKFQNLKSNDINNRKWYENTSGGSTGEPVRFVQEKHYGAWPMAVTKLYDIWTGYYDGQRKVILWGSERDLFVGHETLKIRLGRWLRNELWLNSFRMTPEHMISYVEKINKFKPIQILAYAELKVFMNYLDLSKTRV